MKVKIEISLKDGVLDPQAKAVYNALHVLKFDYVKDLKILKTIIIDINAIDEELAIKQADEMCKILLANLVIETYNIEILH